MKKSKLMLFVCFLLAVIMAFPTAYAAEDTDTMPVAAADLSTISATTTNMQVRMGTGDDAKIAEREGRYGWVLQNKTWNTANYELATGESTINVDLSSAFAYNINDGSVFEIEVDYYDGDCGVFSLLYSAQDRYNRYGGMQMTEGFGAKAVKNTTIKAWRTKTFRVQDAKFINNLNDGDFLISANALNCNHNAMAGMTTVFGTKYAKFYPNRYGRVSTVDDVVIGAIRVKKLKEKNPFSGNITTADHPGNIFYDDENATYNVELTNNTDKAYDLKAHYYAVDTTDNIVKAEKTENISIGGKETKTFTFVQDGMPYGVFRWYVDFTNDDGSIHSQFSTDTSRAREVTNTNSRACTNIHLEGADTYCTPIEILDLIRKAGYSSVREALRWADTEKAKGAYKLRQTVEPTITKCKELGLDYMPVHYCDNEAVYGLEAKPISSEEAFDAYKNYCTWLTNKLEGCGYAQEASNEWNLQYPTGTAEDYTYMMKAMYEGVKAANPEQRVIGVDTGLVDLAQMRRWFEAGALEYMDGVSYHPYDWARAFEVGNQMAAASEVRKLMAEFGHGDKEIWCTETGWHQGLNNRVTNMDKANYIARAILQNDALKVFNRIYFYDFLDDGMEPSYGESSYGTVHCAYDEVPLAAWPAHISASCANWILDGSTFDRAIDGEPDLTAQLYAYRWTRTNEDSRGKYVVGLWTSKDREPYAVDLGVNEATIIDMFGNERTMKAVNGVFNFMLTDSPVYLIGDFTKFDKVEPNITVSERISVATVNDTVIADINVPGAGNAKIIPQNADFVVSENNGFVGDTARYVLNTPELRFFNKCAKFDVVDGDKLIYSGNIKVDNDKTITIKENHGMSDTNSLNRWGIDINVTNNKNSGPVSGTLKIKAPSELVKYVSDVRIDNLNPKETYTCKLFLPEIITKEMRNYDVDVVLDNGEYFNDKHTLFFTTVPYAYNKPTIDGVVSDGEYRTDTWFPIVGGENNKNVEILEVNTVYLGDDDLSGKATAMYDEENIYFFIEITDNQFVNNNTGSAIWDGDSIQIGLADQDTVSSGVYCELTIALTKEGPQMYRHLTNNSANPVGFVENRDLAIIHEGTKTYYEMRIPWTECLLDASGVGPGYTPRFAFLINDDDGLGRNSYMEYSQVLGAIGTAKNVSYFSDMYLADK